MKTKICIYCNLELNIEEFELNGKYYRNLCKPCYKESRKEYRKNYYHEKQKDNVEVQNSNRKWKLDNKDLVNENRRLRNQDDDKKQKNADYIRNKRHSDPIFKLRMNFSNLISYHLKQQTKDKIRKRERSWEILVDYTLDDLVNHLELQFQEGMTWENYGEWHIDHKIPASSFNVTDLDCEDFKKCWSLENLQPLWALDNILKSNRI